MGIVYGDYVIEADKPGGYVIRKRSVARRGKGAGEARERAIGYYPTLQTAISGLVAASVHEGIAAKENMTLLEAVALLNRIHAEIRALSPDVGEEV